LAVVWAQLRCGILTTNVGSANRSWGYHGDDGNKYWMPSAQRLVNSPYGPTFTTHDVVGCGLNCLTNETFFTKNGQVVDVAFSCLPQRVYPVVALASPKERVYVNFGQLPFLWNFDLQNRVTPLKPSTWCHE